MSSLIRLLKPMRCCISNDPINPDDPYTPEIVTAMREKDESAGDFASRLLSH